MSNFQSSWYAIKLNDKYWIGHHAADISGAAGFIGPSLSGAMLIPTNADKRTISKFRNLAKIHGGQLVKLNLDVAYSLDEMLKSKFEPIEHDIYEEESEENDNDEDEWNINNQNKRKKGEDDDYSE